MTEELFHNHKKLKRTKAQLDADLLLILRPILREDIEGWARRFNVFESCVRSLLHGEPSLTDREWEAAERYFKQLELARKYEQNNRSDVHVRFG